MEGDGMGGWREGRGRMAHSYSIQLHFYVREQIRQAKQSLIFSELSIMDLSNGWLKVSSNEFGSAYMMKWDTKNKKKKKEPSCISDSRVRQKKKYTDLPCKSIPQTIGKYKYPKPWSSKSTSKNWEDEAMAIEATQKRKKRVGNIISVHLLYLSQVRVSSIKHIQTTFPKT